ncbi:hypothetical protein L0Y65_02465 [Candidatus Micrarchaeota archaeon]|nr:hypothetical protein [Candidatus Micrarchaeota archaeon]
MRGALIVVLAVALAAFGMGCTGAPEGFRNMTADCLANCTGAAAEVCANGTTYPDACSARCYNATPSFEGACDACKDTDGGKNATVRGTVTSASGNYTDSCVVFESVEEYYCFGAIAQKTTLQCPEGHECHMGACVVKMPPIPEPDCQDSDGKDVYTKGAINASGNVFEDSCIDNKKVKEFYCDQGARSEETDCPGGYECDTGRCVKISGNCTDTDSGNDIYNEGKVIVKDGLIELEFLDKCLDSGYVKEYYCSLGGYIAETVKCPEGFRCVQASCRQDACTDSDGGYEIWRQGGANKGDLLLRDECTGQDTGIEYYCDGNDIMNATFTCPGSAVCEGGRCED